jgi:hypothetical protein
MFNYLLILVLPPVPGFRADLYRKRKLDVDLTSIYPQVSKFWLMRSSIFVLYSANTTPPAWSLIFKGVESTSRRTQAAAIAYLYPHHVPNMMHPWIHFRFTTAHNRRIKLDKFLQCVSPPPQFAHNTHDDYEKVAIVCDSGVDHHVSNRPPPQPKVSVCFYLILFALCFILIYISPHRVIIHCPLGVFLKSTRTYSPLHCPAFIR